MQGWVCRGGVWVQSSQGAAGYSLRALIYELAGHLHQDEGEEGWRKKARGSLSRAGWARLQKGWICKMKLRGLCTTEQALREPPRERNLRRGP